MRTAFVFFLLLLSSAVVSAQTTKCELGESVYYVGIGWEIVKTCAADRLDAAINSGMLSRITAWTEPEWIEGQQKLLHMYQDHRWFEAEVLLAELPNQIEDEWPVDKPCPACPLWKSTVIESHVPDKTFHHCTLVGSSGNSPHLFDVSEIYRCDEGAVEITGQWKETIEYGYVFTTELGRPSRIGPHRASAFDYESNKWCPTPKPWDSGQKERCGDKPITCWDKKPATWDPNWQGFSCATPDHGTSLKTK
jgi:hypothetical protein